jgi:hypothetical protein
LKAIRATHGVGVVNNHDELEITVASIKKTITWRVVPLTQGVNWGGWGGWPRETVVLSRAWGMGSGVRSG